MDDMGRKILGCKDQCLVMRPNLKSSVFRIGGSGVEWIMALLLPFSGIGRSGEVDYSVRCALVCWWRNH